MAFGVLIDFDGWQLLDEKYSFDTEMTVDTDKDEEMATAEEEADTVVRETCIFCTR